jgi:hypothetical protein
MKNILTILVSFLLFVPALAQDDEPEQQDIQAQEKIKAARIAFITERLGLTPEEAEKFWPVYREFSMKRQEMKREFKVNQKQQDPKKTAEENQKDAIERGLKLKQRELDLEKEYSGKLLNTVPAHKVMALRQAEDDFRRILLDQIQKRQMLQQQRQRQLERNDKRLRQRNN